MANEFQRYASSADERKLFRRLWRERGNGNQPGQCGADAMQPAFVHEREGNCVAWVDQVAIGCSASMPFFGVADQAKACDA